MPCHRAASATASAYACSGVVSSSGRRSRSLTTSPPATRSPTAAARSKSWSTAAGKCAPNTSAVVVPARTSPSTNSAATVPAYPVSAIRASSGSAQSFNQSSSGMPSPPITRTWGKWTWVSTSPGSSTPPVRSTTSSSGRAARTRANGPRSTTTPAATAMPQSSSARRRPPANGDSGVSRTVAR